MLTGKRIVLRPLSISDIDIVNRWRNTFDLIKLTQGLRYPTTLEMDKKWFEFILNDMSNKNIYFGIDELKSGSFIGITQLTNVDYLSRNAVWGFVIGEKENQGKGYGKELSALMLDYAFRQLNLFKITSYIVENNEVSNSLFNKLGFETEGKLKKQFFIDNEYYDVQIASLFKEDYLNSKHTI